MSQRQIFEFKPQCLVRMSREDIINQYDIFPIKIGEGNDAVVYKAKQKTANGQWRAIKKIHRRYVEKEQYLLTQIQILKKLDHPGVLKIFEVYDDNQYVFIVTQLCQGNSLFQELRKKDFFLQSEAKTIFKKIIEIIGYCHQNKIIHRDLKPQNLVYCNKDHTPQSLRLIDFGMSFNWEINARTQIKNTFSTNKVVGTIYYTAPEVYKESYDHKVDIWSAGVILFFLLTGQLPFLKDSDQEIIQAIKQTKIAYQKLKQKKCSEQVINLIRKIFEVQTKRISIEQILRHPWFKSLQGKSLIKKRQKLNQFSQILFRKFQIKGEYSDKFEGSVKTQLENYKSDSSCDKQNQRMRISINWKTVYDFLKMSRQQKAIKIYFSYRLGYEFSVRFIRIFNSLKCAKTQRIQLETLYEELKSEYQTLLQKQSNLFIKNLSRDPQKAQSIVYQKKDIYEQLLTFFSHNKQYSIGYTIFVALISDFSDFYNQEIQFIRKSLNERYDGNTEQNLLETQIYKINKIIGQVYLKNNKMMQTSSFDFQINICSGDKQKDQNYLKQRQLPKLTLNLRKDPKTNLIIKKSPKKTIKQNILESISPTFIKKDVPKPQHNRAKTQSKKKNQPSKDQQPDSPGFLFGINKILGYF